MPMLRSPGGGRGPAIVRHFRHPRRRPGLKQPGGQGIFYGRRTAVGGRDIIGPMADDYGHPAAIAKADPNALLIN
jgi:hypothetical protein